MFPRKLCLMFSLLAILIAPLAAASPTPTVFDTAAIPNATAQAVEKMAASNDALAALIEARSTAEAAISAYNAARDRYISAHLAAQSGILATIEVADGVFQSHKADTPPDAIIISTAPPVEPEPEIPAPPDDEVSPTPADPAPTDDLEPVQLFQRRPVKR